MVFKGDVTKYVFRVLAISDGHCHLSECFLTQGLLGLGSMYCPTRMRWPAAGMGTSVMP